MEYKARVKFNASISATQDLVPGTAVTGGFVTSALPTANQGKHHYILEKAATGEVETGMYDGSQGTVANRRITGAGFRFAASTTGLVCSFIAATNAYVCCTTTGMASTPTVNSNDSVALGDAATVGDGSVYSLAVGNSATADGGSADLGYCVAVGCLASASAGLSTALGANANVTNDSDTRTGGTAVGANAKTATAGEVALGQRDIPHMGFVPVRADSGVSAGGTFPMRAIGYNNAGTMELYDIPSYPLRYTPDGSFSYAVRVQGTIVARATATANFKSWNIDFMFDGTTLLYSTFTVLHAGANNPAITWAATSSGALEVTAPAIAGLFVTGVLTVTKIAL